MKEPNEPMKLAMNIMNAVVKKFDLTGRYDVAVKRHAVEVPWIEVCLCRIGKPIETHEYTYALPESRFILETKEERTALAILILKQLGTILGKIGPKE